MGRRARQRHEILEYRPELHLLALLLPLREDHGLEAASLGRVMAASTVAFQLRREHWRPLNFSSKQRSKPYYKQLTSAGVAKMNGFLTRL